ncbi:MAG: hypothetical protein ACRD3J_26460, partial [Thermoanaerobaculia bacterium]
MTAIPVSSVTAQPRSRELFFHSAEALLRLAVSICGVRFGVVRIAGEAPIANDPAAPLAAEEPLARLASSQDSLFVILDDQLRRNAGGEVRFYAAVMLLNGAGALHGTFALFDDRPR